MAKVKNFFQKSEGEPLNSSPSVMPSLKKSLAVDIDEAKLIRQRLFANSKRTPSSTSVSESTLIDKDESDSRSSNNLNTAGDERVRHVLKRTTSSVSSVDRNGNPKDCGPTKSPRLEPEYPLSVPPTPSVERLGASPDVKHPPGTFRDESWPVSTASASAMVSASSCGLPNSHLLTPRNVLAWMTSTPAHARASYQIDSPLSNCLLTPSNATGNNSMSPITRSTQKMPKAMQVRISLKPYLLLCNQTALQLMHALPKSLFVVFISSSRICYFSS